MKLYLNDDNIYFEISNYSRNIILNTSRSEFTPDAISITLTSTESIDRVKENYSNTTITKIRIERDDGTVFNRTGLQYTEISVSELMTENSFILNLSIA